jgi:hypothetical protein
MARGVFIVQIASQQTGSLTSLRVEASSRSEAMRQVTDLGEKVVHCSLSDVIDASEAAVAVPALPTNDSSAAATVLRRVQPTGNWEGVYLCSQCGGYEWMSSRRFLFWLAILLLFPFGLFLFRLPQAWQCRNCGCFLKSSQRPTGMRVRHSIPSRIARGVVVGLLGLMFIVAVAGAVRSAVQFLGVDIGSP